MAASGQAFAAAGGVVAGKAGQLGEQPVTAARPGQAVALAGRPVWDRPGERDTRLLRRLGVADSNIGVFQSQTAAWAAGADGSGVAPAIEHLVSRQLHRGELSLIDLPGFPVQECWYATLPERERRSTVASALRRFLGTPEAMQVMRSPTAGVSPSRFKPPVYVTIWS